VLVAVGATTLALGGYASGAIATGSGPVATDDPADQRYLDAGPVLDLRDDDVASLVVPPRTVVLTFDDGPDPTWTPAVLDVLADHDVPATFFLVGEHVADHPGLVQDELDASHEIANHTFSHADLGALPGWRANLELSLTQLTIAGATGRHVALVRPPFSSTPAALSAADAAVLEQTADQGYLSVLSDRDSEDWRRPGVDRIVTNALPDGNDGGILLFHDGGGDREQTVEALDRVIDELHDRGYAFRTVGDLLAANGTTAPTVDEPAVWQGRIALFAVRWSQRLTWLLGLLMVPIGILAVGRSVLVVHLARRHRRRVPRADETPPVPVSVVVPAYNEEANIAATVGSMLASTHPATVEIVVVDDGSTDATPTIVKSFADRGVRLLRQPNQGKAAALASGIAATQHDVVVTADGDTIFEPDAISALVAPFRDAAVGAVSGNTKVGNRRGLLGRWQHLEYVMGFNLDRRMYEELDCMPTVPGAVGAFRRQALDDAGGPSDDTLAEDTDLTMAINRAGWRVVYAESAVAWTEAPSSLGGLWRQRYRWCYGTLQAIWKHRAALREGSPLGRRGLPYLLFFQVALPILAPLVDLFALYGLVFLDPAPVLAFWLGFTLLQMAIAVYALRLDGESLRPVWVLPFQQFVYRQLMYLVVIQSVVTAAVGVALPWQRVERTGTAGEAAPVG
jgi:cellulose synthase/poly-beta-1,6-N-acetylglucosamine synthase-like glycosyltransferase/peptidoglycan/xylan/chitin deacetylase (PgdA/CDA1 family)